MIVDSQRHPRNATPQIRPAARPSHTLFRTGVTNTSLGSTRNSQPFLRLQPLHLSWPSFSRPFPLFSATSSLFFQNTQGGVSPRSLHDSGDGTPSTLRNLLTFNFQLWTSALSGPSLSPFRMNTCRTVTKQTTLTPFRMNTCEKPGGGGEASAARATQRRRRLPGRRASRRRILSRSWTRAGLSRCHC